MYNEDIRIDRIGKKLWEALWRLLDGLNTDNLALLVAYAYHLADAQKAKEMEAAE